MAMKTKQMTLVNPDAAGIDIGSTSHFVAIPGDRDENPVREFRNFTQDLYVLADWLKSCGIKTVAMESTSVYWIPVYEILEARGFEVYLVNARHIKNVPGRKSDVLDCQWIQQLHTFGLLRASFRPDQSICILRAYLRQRESLIQSSSQQVLHMQKALAQMNVLLMNVVSDIVGVTGLTIIRAILSGERCAKKLAGYRDGRCRQSVEVIERSLQGNYRSEHLFALRQAVELFDCYQTKIVECDHEIEQVLQRLAPLEATEFEEAEPVVKKKKKKGHDLSFNADDYLKQMTGGVNLTRIDGLGAHSVLKIISEMGVDMSRWPTAKHLGSWLGLAPGTKVSGGKRLSGKTKPSSNRAATALRIAACTLHRSQSALGAFLRRQKARLGAPKAITATAYKIARLIYHLLKNHKEYKDPGADYYNKKYQEKILQGMQKKAATMGLRLVPITTAVSEVP
jgi:transposase